MGKLIDADAVIASIGDDASVYEKYCAAMLGAVPEAVVRCKDCAWYNKTKNSEWSKNLHLCKNYEYYMNDNDFCSHGVRRK